MIWRFLLPLQLYLGPVLAGMAAGTASSLVRVPTEVIKQRLQTKEFAGAITAVSTHRIALICPMHPHFHTVACNTQVRSVIAKEGITGLYAGYGAFMLRDLPFDAIEFVSYEQVSDWRTPCAASWVAQGCRTCAGYVHR